MDKNTSDYNAFSQNWDYRFQVLLGAILSEHRDIRIITWE